MRKRGESLNRGGGGEERGVIEVGITKADADVRGRRRGGLVVGEEWRMRLEEKQVRVGGGVERGQGAKRLLVRKVACMCVLV